MTLTPVAFLSWAALIRWDRKPFLECPEVTIGAASCLAVATVVLIAQVASSKLGATSTRDRRYIWIGVAWALVVTIGVNLLLTIEVNKKAIPALGRTGWVLLACSVGFMLKCLFGKFADAESEYSSGTL